jgi:Na+-translocating ferredoxin:NAD+ oxidoreductase RnfG subunit
MIQRVLEWASGSVDEKILVLIMIALVAIMFVCGVVAIVTLDRDNEEMKMILKELLKEKRATEDEKKACQK